MFLELDNCRPEVPDDVVSGMTVDVRVRFGDSVLNRCRIIRLFAVRTILHTSVQYLNAFCSRPAGIRTSLLVTSYPVWL